MNVFSMNTTLNPAFFASLTSTIVLATATASFAAATQITQVEVIPASNGVQLQLQTTGGDRPQVFAVPRGNSWVADVINTELSLSSGGNFSQQNPADGIQSITIAPLDSNSVRITITGETGAPDAQLTDRADNTLTFGVIPNTSQETTAQSITVSPASQPIAQTNSTKEPEVLFPNPEITITDNAQATPIPRQNPAPAFLPRAVAPPLGDIAVSNLVPNIGNDVDLGTAQRVPRLALRDAPAREVLSLLARAAGLNLAYIGNGSGGTSSSTTEGSDGTTTVAVAGGEGPSITLDIENEPVQDVFNYVLKLTELQAVRQGRTILVGPELPQDTRNTIVRTLRINQADAAAVANYLVAQGAEARLVQNVTTRTVTGEGTVNQAVQETTNTQVVSIAPKESSVGAPTILKGLTVVTDDRLNTLTLVGNSNIVDLATSFSKQLDLRQRQVAVNVKVVDIELDNDSSFTSSFSFGLGDAFVVNDGGQGAVNIGEFAPSSQSEASNRVSRPLITNPYTVLPTVVDFNQSISIPSTVQIINNSTGQIVGSIPVTGEQFTRTSTLTDDAFERVVQVTGGTPGQLRFTDTNSNGLFDAADTVSNFIAANFGTVTETIPSIIQYPDEFLLRLRAAIVSTNAKILTDPTLIIQDGQNATVNITDNVLTDITETTTTVDGGTAQTTVDLTYEEAGLVLSITVDGIDDNGFITMEVQPRITSASPAYVYDSPTRPDVPVFQTSKRQLNSGKIRMRDGQTLILAGIIQESDTETVTKWPILGDLPIIGALFRNTSGNKTRNEVIIVVTPQILDDSDASNFGYSYTPSPEVQKILDQRNPR